MSVLTQASRMSCAQSPYVLASVYKFFPFPDYEALRLPLLTECRRHNLCGTFLLASEGLNGTISGGENGVSHILDFLRRDPRLRDIKPKFASHSHRPFKKMKVRLKKEIVSLGQADVSPLQKGGTYVAPKDWNTLIQKPDILVLDTRNTYEYRIGTFKGAIDPNIQTFRAFPDWVQTLKYDKKPPIAMFCTGGIRCEKASAYMINQGFDTVFQLEGGIVKYLEQIPEDQSLWRGDCFVFDERVSVGHGLISGRLSCCCGCGYPLSPEDLRQDPIGQKFFCPACRLKNNGTPNGPTAWMNE